MPKFYISNTEALLMQVEYFVSYDRPHFLKDLSQSSYLFEEWKYRNEWRWDVL